MKGSSSSTACSCPDRLVLLLFLLLRGGGVLMGREMLERPLLLLSVWEKMEERGGVERRVRVRQHGPE